MRSLPPIAALPLLALLAAIGGCGDTGDDEPRRTAPTTEDGGRGDDGGGDDDGGRDGGKPCPAPAEDRTLEPVAAEVVADDPPISAVVYPHPDYRGRPWSQWGQGIVAEGRFFSAIGDHCGVNGDSYLFAFDPATATLEPLGDVLSLVDHEDGDWGYGKIHAQMVEGPDGAIYVTTFWGSNDGIRFEGSYEGDRLLRIDPGTGAVTDLGAPLPGHGIPSLAGSAPHGLLYGEAIEPDSEPRRTVFFAYDIEAGEVVFTAEKGDTSGVRSILVDDDGRAHYSTEGGIDVFDPATGESAPASLDLPGEWLRAASAPRTDGTVFGVTREPDALFALRPDGEVQDMGPVRDYVASIALSPDGRTLYYVPDAHGRRDEATVPLVAVDTASGAEEVVVDLASVEDGLGLRFGGTYDVVLDPAGERIYIGMNAGAAGADDTFGEVVLLVVEL